MSISRHEIISTNALLLQRMKQVGTSFNDWHQYEKERNFVQRSIDKEKLSLKLRKEFQMLKQNLSCEQPLKNV